CTVEVKSNLSKDHLFKALDAIQAWRSLKRVQGGISLGAPPLPRMLNYIFAYSGPTMLTTMKHIEEYCNLHRIREEPLVDLCVTLRRGVILPNDGAIFKQPGKGDYLWYEQEQDNLFILLISWFSRVCTFLSTPPNLALYIINRNMPHTDSGIF